MADEPRTPPNTPAAELNEAAGKVRPLRAHEAPRTLVSSLIPVVDQIRQLYTGFGMRPYRVYLVYVEWPSGNRGVGAPQEVARVELTPTPNIRSLDSTQQVLEATGMAEEGSISIDQISARYSEDDLLGKTPLALNPADPRTKRKAVQFFWEVVEDRTASAPKRRRYHPSGVPSLNKAGYSWSVNLVKQDADLSRSGGSGRLKGDQ